AHEIDSSDVVLTLTDNDIAANLPSVPRATARFGGGAARPFTIADRQTEHVRHRHKYADTCLPSERRFYFHSTDGQYIHPAATMSEFHAAVSHLDQRALQYHLGRGDFSRWLDGTIADRDFAKQVAAWEDEVLARHAADLERIRHQLVRALEERYLLPDTTVEPPRPSTRA